MNQFNADDLDEEQRKALYENLKSKYGTPPAGGDPADDSAVQAATEAAKGSGLVSGIGSILGSLGSMNARARGLKVEESDGGAEAQRVARQRVMDAKADRREKMAEARDVKDAAWQDESRGQQRKEWSDKGTTASSESDPSSMESKSAQALAKKLMPNGNFDGMTAAQLKKSLPTLEKMYEVDNKRVAGSAAPKDKDRPYEYMDDQGNKRVGRYVTGQGLVRDPGDAVTEAKKGDQDFKGLPPEDQEVIKDLAKKNASKIAIANQIESVMSNWGNLSDNQKVSQGGQLLKILNSTEGADAIGVEEAKRLGSKLEFAFGNFSNGQPTQFGRDLEGFETQANDTVKGIRGGVTANQGEIDRRYGRAPKDVQATAGTKNGATGSWGEARADTGRKVAHKFYSPSKNQTKFIYSDGTEEVVDGKK